MNVDWQTRSDLIQFRSSYITKEIINSEAFRIINHLIDEDVQRALYLMKDIKEYHVNRIPTFGKIGFRTRIAEETEKDVVGEICLTNIEKIKQACETILKTYENVQTLQATKCKLLNDYDFTKDDNSLAEKIFSVDKNQKT